MIVNDKRELAYVVNIDAIEPIEGKDRVEAAVVGGWRVMVKKDEFKPGDAAVYFEIDSLVDASSPAFAFLAQRKYKIKTQKYKAGDGHFFSQGLIMSFADLGIEPAEVGTPLTESLKVKYYVEEDNKRKSTKGDPNEKYKRMCGRHIELARKSWWRWLMKRQWGRDLLFVFFGKVKDKNKGWPIGKFPGVSKTDQERIQNMIWVLEDKTPYIVTQKCDGSSATFILSKIRKNKFEKYVCSRNVRMLEDTQSSFHNEKGEKNLYWEAVYKYDIFTKMQKYLEASNADWICWQGELCGPSIQANPHHLTDLHLFCFHWTDSINGRLDMITANTLWKSYDMEVVPIMDTNFILPNKVDELLKYADGNYNSDVCEGQTNCMREGVVLYKSTDPTFSFKAVSNEYLAKKHN